MRTLAAISISLVLAIAVIYGQTVHHPFIAYDDPEYIYANPEITGGLTLHGIAWAFTASHADNWHPLTWISHQLDWQLFRDWAGGHHLVSVMLHAATAVLLLLVLRRMTGRLWPSALVAAIFALHPLRVESVAWAAERKDVLSGLFFVLTLGAYARYCRFLAAPNGSARERGLAPQVPVPLPGPAARFRHFAPVVVLFALGLMAKPMLVTLPLVLLLLDYWPLGRFGPPPAGMQEGEAKPRRPAQRQEFLKTPLVPDGTPIAKLSVPPSTRARALVAEKVPLLILSAASCVVTLIVQVKPIAANLTAPLSCRLANAVVAYVAYLGQFLCPVNLTLLYPHPGDRIAVWKVLASLLTLLALSAGAAAGRRRHPYLLVGWLWYLGMLVPVIGLVQVGAQAIADRYTYLPQIGIVLALVWGADELRRRWQWRPKVVGVASVLVLLGLTAMACLQTSYWRDDVTLWRHALRCTENNDGAHESLAEALSDLGQIDDALAEYQVVLKMRGADPTTLYNMGVAFDRAGRAKQSIACYEESLRVQPDSPRTHLNLANALAGEEKTLEAIGHYDEAIRQKPDYIKANINLAWLLATTDSGRGGDPGRAIVLAQRACRLAGDDSPVSLDVLAAAYASAGRFPEAVATAQKAVRAASATGDAALAGQIAARLQLYRQNRAGFESAHSY